MLRLQALQGSSWHLQEYASKAKTGLSVIQLNNGQFIDKQGRYISFRGINLSGSSKLPYGHKSHEARTLNNKDITFVGRPFPLTEADEHFSRLKTWGFNLIRFVVTWEALEHKAPGVYDEAYLAYARVLLEKAAAYGFYIYVDPHQDVWSRFCGGDGAPAWTLEMAGFDLERLADSGAATLHAIHGNPFPHMIWGSNYGKLASATMFTLFWAGRDLAPRTKHEGTSLQTILQESYSAAFAKLASELSHIPQVIGFGVMNEPSAGFIGMPDLNQKAPSLLLRGPSPTVLQGMTLGAGLRQKVEFWDFGLRGLELKRFDEVNLNRTSAWRDSKTPIWQENGVWTLENNKPQVLKPKHFSEHKGKTIEFYHDYYLPFARRYLSQIESVAPNRLYFVEGVPADTKLYWPEKQKEKTSEPLQSSSQIVHAPHWYDVATLISKRFLSWLSYDAQHDKLIFGKKNIEKTFDRHLKLMKQVSLERMNNAATLIGEIGIPMDLEGKKAYKSHNYQQQSKALDRSLSTLERNLLSYCLWNYTPDNTHAHGDGWNAEDFSIYNSEGKDKTLPKAFISDPAYLGGRALQAVVRPYAMLTVGKPLRMRFNLKHKTFELYFESKKDLATIIFVPHLHYPNGYTLEHSGRIEQDDEQQLLYFYATSKTSNFIKISPIKSEGALA